eukprot:5095886-Pyramimonas_sp.AAC.8
MHPRLRTAVSQGCIRAEKGTVFPSLISVGHREPAKIICGFGDCCPLAFHVQTKTPRKCGARTRTLVIYRYDTTQAALICSIAANDAGTNRYCFTCYSVAVQYSVPSSYFSVAR